MIEGYDQERLRATVQHNCHIADARHARDLPLCIYLMKMREYYRWESGRALTGELTQAELGEWLHEREHYWDTVESEEFERLPLKSRCHDPFDDEGVNRVLAPDNLVYSAGIGRFGQPHFFLGKLLGSERRGEIDVHLAGEELARHCAAPPAMARGHTIYVRRDALRRHWWEMVQSWQWGRASTAARRVLEHFAFEIDPGTAIENLTDAEIGTAVLHEVGEVGAGALLGPRWEHMLNAVLESKAELICRAVRDNLADCSTTLPALLEDSRVSSLDCYFASFGGLRRDLFPAAVDGYHRWCRGGSLDALGKLVDRARRHWGAVAVEMLDCFSRQPDEMMSAIPKLIERGGRL